MHTVPAQTIARIARHPDNLCYGFSPDFVRHVSTTIFYNTIRKAFRELSPDPIPRGLHEG